MPSPDKERRRPQAESAATTASGTSISDPVLLAEAVAALLQRSRERDVYLERILRAELRGYRAGDIMVVLAVLRYHPASKCPAARRAP